MSFLGDIFSGASAKANDFNAQAGQVYSLNNDQLAGIQGQQQDFANSLKQQAAGTGGPSAATQLLQNANQQQTATANALAASQQGSINPGLATRNAQTAAVQGQQNNAAQSAVLRQQEQLNAQGMLGGQLNNMFQQVIGTQGMNQAAGLQAAGINAGVIADNAKRSSSAGAGLLGGISSTMASGFGGKAHGGMIHNYADGGQAANAPLSANDFIKNAGAALVANQAQAAAKDPLYQGANEFGAALGKGMNKGIGSISDYFKGSGEAALPVDPVMNKGGEVIRAANGLLVKKPLPPMKKVKAMISPGEGYLSPEQVQDVLGGADPLKSAHKVPGKAQVKGDSLKNDTVPAALEEGGVVIPRTKMMSPEKAAAFVRRAVAKKGLK